MEKIADALTLKSGTNLGQEEDKSLDAFSMQIKNTHNIAAENNTRWAQIAEEKGIVQKEARDIERNDLLLQYKKTGDTEIRNELIRQLMPLVMHIVKKYDYVNQLGIDVMDIVQEGCMALFNGIDDFIANKDTDFTGFGGYLGQCIEHKILEYMYTKKGSPVWEANHATLKYYKHRYNKMNLEYKTKYGVEIPLEKAAEKLKITVSRLSSVLSKDTSAVQSLDAALKTRLDDGDLSLGDVIPDSKTENVMNSVLDNIYSEEFMQSLKANLAEDDYQFLVMRYGLDGSAPKNFPECEKVLGVERRVLWQREQNIFNYLRKLVSMREFARGIGLECNDEGVEVIEESSQEANENIKDNRGVLKIVGRKRNKKACEDHKGNMYTSITEMCNAYGISTDTFKQRIREGWSLKDALTTEVRSALVAVEDHKGNKYESKTAMCKAYGIDIRIFHARIDSGWTLEKALTTAAQSAAKRATDHLGNEYISKTDMYKAWGVSDSEVRKRLNRGWTLERALTTGGYDKPLEEMFLVNKQAQKKKKPTKEENFVTDHLGNKYSSQNEMCRAYGINPSTFRARIKKGFSIEKALTSEAEVQGQAVVDHLGNEYPSTKAMVKAWGVNETTFACRIKTGKSIEEALTAKTQHEKKGVATKDHLGKEYSSFSTMCKEYGLKKDTVRKRIKHGWTLEKALTTMV